MFGEVCECFVEQFVLLQYFGDVVGSCVGYCLDDCIELYGGFFVLLFLYLDGYELFEDDLQV